MKITKLYFDGVFEIILEPYVDERGVFVRAFDNKILIENGIDRDWVQENHSISYKSNTLRGLHFILPPHTDGKLIRCIRGKVYDVFIDLRKDSQTLGQWSSIILSDDEFKFIYLPRGFAHGFCTLIDHTEILYKHDASYNKDFDCGIKWDDPKLNITWPVANPIISNKDAHLMNYTEFISKYGGL